MNIVTTEERLAFAIPITKNGTQLQAADWVFKYLPNFDANPNLGNKLQGTIRDASGKDWGFSDVPKKKLSFAYTHINVPNGIWLQIRVDLQSGGESARLIIRYKPKSYIVYASPTDVIKKLEYSRTLRILNAFNAAFEECLLYILKKHMDSDKLSTLLSDLKKYFGNDSVYLEPIN